MNLKITIRIQYLKVKHLATDFLIAWILIMQQLTVKNLYEVLLIAYYLVKIPVQFTFTLSHILIILSILSIYLAVQRIKLLRSTLIAPVLLSFKNINISLFLVLVLFLI